MQKISSKSTYFHKRIFPIIWFGFLGLMMLIFCFSAVVKSNGPWFAGLIIPIFLAVFGFFLFKKLLFDLVDEVFDCGSYLLIKNGGQEVQIPLSNIKNVSYSTMVNPPRVTLSLREACSLGREVAFSPPTRFSFNLFQKNPLIEELIDRIDRARRS